MNYTTAEVKNAIAPPLDTIVPPVASIAPPVVTIMSAILEMENLAGLLIKEIGIAQEKLAPITRSEDPEVVKKDCIIQEGACDLANRISVSNTEFARAIEKIRALMDRIDLE